MIGVGWSGIFLLLRIFFQELLHFHRSNGAASGRHHNLAIQRVLHVPGLGFDGYVGYSPIRMAREAIGLGVASEKASASERMPATMRSPPGI